MKTHFALFWRPYLFVGLLLVATLGSLGLVGAARVEHVEFVAAQDRLATEAALLDELARTDNLDEFRDHLESLHQQFGARITLIADDGTVIADTDRSDPANLDNHASRPEIVAAQSHPIGRATRNSDTLNQRMMYVARRVGKSRSAVAFVRVAVPMEAVEREASSLRLSILLIIGMTSILSLILVWGLARPHTSRLDELVRGANAIANGDFGHRIYIDGADGIGRIGQAFNVMSAQLERQLAQVDQDRQKLLGVLSSLVEGVLAIDAERNLIFANERAAELLGFKGSDIAGKKLWQVIRLRPVLDLAKQTLEGSTPQTPHGNWITHGDRHLTVRAAPLSGAAGPGCVLIFHDVTELARLERLRQDFVANVSHELKTPLSVVLACVETMQAGAIDDRENRDRFLSSIATHSQRLSALIDDMLVLARAESEMESLSLHEVAVDNVIEEVVIRHRPNARAKQQQLIIVPPESVAPADAFAWANEGALDEVLDRLLTNAIDYTPANGRVEVHWSVQEDQCTIEVRDNGIGIPATDLPRVFERFYRMNKARNRESGGPGLGLSIVKHLVQKMGGNIQASSEPGKGSTFTVILNRK